MPSHISRRRFLLWVPAAGAGLYGLAGSGIRRAFGQEEATHPMLLTSMDYRVMGDVAGPMLMAGQSGLAALDAAMAAAETDPSIPVGAGGYAGSAGEVELAALIMSGPAHDLGAVAALRNAATPSRVARKVMEETRHVLLADEGALRFARRQGFGEEVLTPAPRTQAVASVGAIALDAHGDMWVAVSGSAHAATDLPGQMGAEALAGAGAYVDNDVGGAVSWGAAHVAIRFQCAYQAVENMRRGMPASHACNEVLKRIHSRGINWDGGLLALGRHGDVGALSPTQRFPFWIYTDGQNLPRTGRLARPSPGKPAAAVYPRAARPAGVRQASLPVVLSLYYSDVNTAVGQAILEGAHPLDAIAAGINIVERDRNIGAVGAGNNVTISGTVELDAGVMSGPDFSFASIGSLQHVDVPISVARRLLELHPNTFLAGQGALAFALAQGFTYQESLTRENTGKSAGLSAYHDTTGAIVMDADRNFWAGMSTSGTGQKLPGRIGDSPQAGPGLYIDNEVGAAIATGVGEEIIRFVCCYQVVEYMRQGYSPTEAMNFVVNRLWAKKHYDFVAFVAINKDGEYASLGGTAFTIEYHIFEDGATTSQRSLRGTKVDVPVLTAVTGAPSQVVPFAHELLPNYPNPFNATTHLSFALARPERVVLRVYDARGAMVRQLLDERRPAGPHRLTWDGHDSAGRQVASGDYFLELRAGSTRLSNKMTLLR